MFQNDGRFLAEWVEFHRLMGATKFFLYDNLSDDGGRDVLAPLVATGEVEIFDWPYLGETIAQFVPIVASAYDHALGLARERGVKWLAILDTDEFLFPTETSDLVSFLREFEGVGGVAVHWQLFGTSGVEEVPRDRLMIELLTRRAPDRHHEHIYLKSIVRPHRVTRMIDPHLASYRRPYHAVGQRWKPVRSSVDPELVLDRVRINHYWSRDLRFFREEKLERRVRLFGDEGERGQHERLAQLEVVEDATIQRFVPALRRRMGLT